MLFDKKRSIGTSFGPHSIPLVRAQEFLFGNTFAATSLKFSAQTNPPPQKQKTNKQTNKQTKSHKKKKPI